MAIALAVLGIASIVYGATVLSVQSGTLFFMVWFVLGALLLAAAFAYRQGLIQMLPAPAMRAIAGCIAVALAGFLGTQVLIASHMADAGEPDLDYLIVLGAQVRADGSPSGVLDYRLAAARDYLQNYPSTMCIVSGGQGPNEPMPEADGMAAALVSMGIDEKRIIREPASLNTKQNIVNSMALIDPEHDRVGIVTNNFHVCRTTLIAHKAGLKNVCGIAAGSNAWFQPNNMLRESMGLVKDFAAGNL